MKRQTATVISKPGSIRSAITLFKEYFFKSDERYSALLLLLGIILGVVALVALDGVFAWWIVQFWTAVTEMSYPLYIQSIQYFFVLVTGFISASVMKDYWLEVLSNNWRKWLSHKLINNYTADKGNNYLELARHHKQIDNPPQRIQEDVLLFVTQTLKLSTELLSSILTQVTFIGTLWVVGGALSFVIFGATITIPGYLVWAALLFAAGSSCLTHLLGSALTRLANQQKGYEADFRKDIECMSADAESIAQEQGAVYYKNLFLKKFQFICTNTYAMIQVRMKLSAFNGFYNQISVIFPYIVAAPLYFAKKTSLGQLMQIGMSFGNINRALSWFSDSYEALATYKVSVERIAELEKVMEPQGLITASKLIVRKEDATLDLKVDNLSLTPPSSTEYLLRELQVKFKRGEHTLIKGSSGLGKSTLFKAIAGTWEYGEGSVSVPKGQKICFLPQKPSLSNTTLKAILAYPDPTDTYTDERYRAVLRSVGKLDFLIESLDSEQKECWSQRLSGGQQQKISFARALLKRPDWLFLDEATASLDTESELNMYSLVREELKDTTIISIAHRPTVEQFHSRVIHLTVDETRRATY